MVINIAKRGRECVYDMYALIGAQTPPVRVSLCGINERNRKYVSEPEINGNRSENMTPLTDISVRYPKRSWWRHG